jgi:aspartyl-tRNA synthetase
MLDLEMSFKQHYFEIVDTINSLFVHIFDGLKTNYKHELNVVANQYPFELIEYPKELI